MSYKKSQEEKIKKIKQNIMPFVEQRIIYGWIYGFIAVILCILWGLYKLLIAK